MLSIQYRTNAWAKGFSYLYSNPDKPEKCLKCLKCAKMPKIVVSLLACVASFAKYARSVFIMNNRFQAYGNPETWKTK
jgi:hypothetical protein